MIVERFAQSMLNNGCGIPPCMYRSRRHLLSGNICPFVNDITFILLITSHTWGILSVQCHMIMKIPLTGNASLLHKPIVYYVTFEMLAQI